MRLLAALLVIAALGAFAMKPTALAPLPPEATFRVASAPARLTVGAVGVLVSSVEQAVNLNGVWGQIEDLVEEGSHVEKGAVVGRLTTFQWEEQERNARQDVYKKQAEMKRTQRENSAAAADDGKKTDEKKEELAYNKRVLDFLESGPDPRTVDSLSLKIQKAKLEDAAAERRLGVQQALKDRGYLSELDYESLKTDQVKAQLERAKQENLLADKRDGPRPEERERSRRQVDRYVIDHELAARSQVSQEVLRELAISKKETELKDRQAAVEEKAKLRDKAVVRAPIAGTVIYGDRASRGEPVGIGATVYSGMTLVKIVERGTMHADLDVPERWLDRIQPGQAVTIYAAQRTKPHQAKVLTVSKLASAMDDDPKSARQFRVVVELAQDDRALKPNMTCVADIEIAHHAGVERLPVDLVRARGKGQVTVAARRGREKVDLTATLVDEDRDFVYVSGLPEGEVLIY